VYALPCGDINQYQYWNADFIRDLMQGTIKKISYIDFRETKHCAEQFFNQCHSVGTLSQHQMIPLIHKWTKPVSLYVYECSKPRRLIGTLSGKSTV
jgi:L-ribulose-5-phosphate 3-epimerase UlaE